MTDHAFEVVFFGPLPFSDIERTGWRKTSGAMARALSEEPKVARLWYVEVGTRRGARATTSRISERLSVIRLPTALPFERIDVIRKANRSWQSRELARIIGPRRRPRVGWFYDWLPVDLAASLPWDWLVMEVTDAASEFHATNEHALRRLPLLRDRCRRVCSLIVCVSGALAPECEGGRARVLVEANGIDTEFLDEAMASTVLPPLYANVPGPRLLVVGSEWSTAQRVDHGFLGEVMDRLSGWTLVIVGCGKRMPEILDQLLRRSDVRSLPVLPRRELIPLMKHATVCAVPYRVGSPRRDVLKMYEYVACGRPVVSRVDPPPKGLEAWVDLADTPGQFAETCRRRAEAGELPVELVQRELRGRTWGRRVDRILRELA